MGEALPQRFVGVYHPHGIAAELFTRRPADTDTRFDLGYQDSPLEPFDDAATYGRSFKEQIIVIEGLDLLSSTNGHESAATILTGSQITDERAAKQLARSVPGGRETGWERRRP